MPSVSCANKWVAVVFWISSFLEQAAHNFQQLFESAFPSLISLSSSYICRIKLQSQLMLYGYFNDVVRGW